MSSLLRLKRTVHIGQTIRVSAIFVCRVNTSKFFTLLISPVLFICIWYLDDQFWWRVNRNFGNILVFFFCQEIVEISIWHKSIWKLYWSEFVNGRKDIYVSRCMNGAQMFECDDTSAYLHWLAPPQENWVFDYLTNKGTAAKTQSDRDSLFHF